MRRLLTTALIFSVVTAGATVALGTGAAWATTTCNGSPPGPTIQNTTIYDSVFVPNGGFCYLQNVKVYGGVSPLANTSSTKNAVHPRSGGSIFPT